MAFVAAESRLAPISPLNCDSAITRASPRDKREAFARRSCSNNKLELDDDSRSKISHPAARAAALLCASIPGGFDGSLQPCIGLDLLQQSA